MGIIKSSEIADQRRGPTFAGDGTFHRTYTRVFQVITDSYFTGGLQALIQGTAIPRLYSFYDTRPQGGVEYDLGALLVGYDVYTPEADTPDRWLVRCDYASRHLDPSLLSHNQGASPSHEGGGDHNENPLLKPSRFTYRNNNQRRTLYASFGYWQFNAFGGTPGFTGGETPIINSADQAYNPGPEVGAPQKTLTISRNEASYNPLSVMIYEEKVNSAPFLGFPAGCVKCDWIDGEGPLMENGVRHWAVTYQFSIRRSNFAPESPGDPWDWPVIDQGTYYFDADDNEQVFQDSNGNPKPSGFLDGSGGKLADSGQPIFYAFRVYDRIDLNSLGLP